MEEENERSNEMEANDALFRDAKVHTLVLAEKFLGAQAVNGREPLLQWAVRTDDVEAATVLLRTKSPGEEVCVNKRGFFGRSVLFFVQSAKMLKLLLRAGAEVNLRNEDGTTALYAAVATKNVAVTRSFIEAGANVNAQSSICTPLMVAIRNDAFACASLLLAAGAEVDTKFYNPFVKKLIAELALRLCIVCVRKHASKLAYTALEYACASKKDDMFALLRLYHPMQTQTGNE